MCNDIVFDLWKATGKLGALLWYPVINNMEQYLVSQLRVVLMLFVSCLTTIN